MFGAILCVCKLAMETTDPKVTPENPQAVGEIQAQCISGK